MLLNCEGVRKLKKQKVHGHGISDKCFKPSGPPYDSKFLTIYPSQSVGQLGQLTFYGTQFNPILQGVWEICSYETTAGPVYEGKWALFKVV